MSEGTSRYSEALQTLRRGFVQAGAFSAAVNLLMLTGPLFMLQIYDRVMASGSVPTLLGLFLIVVVLYAFLGLYEFMRARILSRAAYHLDRQVGELVFAQHLDPRQAAKGGALRDLGIMRGFLSGPALRGLFDVPWMPIFLAAVFLIHPTLGFLTLGGAAVVVVLAYLNRRLTAGPTTQAMTLDGQERGFVDQCQRGAETIGALGMRTAIMGRWRRLHDAALIQSQAGGDLSDGFSAVSRAFRLLLQSLLLSAGAYLALQQQISMGMIVGTSILAGRALAPIDQVIAQWRGIGLAAEAHKRLKARIDTSEAENPPVKLPEIRGAVQLDTVIKLAPGAAQPANARILDQISFALEPGDGLCVLGNSAAGKSSLARLLVGAWAPDHGHVRLDGATLDQWAPDELGRRIGYLPQSVELFPGTIAENIARFDPKADGRAVFEATTVAGVHEMILGLPDGYATRVGPGGHMLSGGQLQRIGLARAVYGMPKFVVLDEPNAHLDVKGDEALVETVARLRARGGTVVVMTHRPSLIAAANKVLILHKGRVAQFGDKEQIMRAATKAVSNPVAAQTPDAAAAGQGPAMAAARTTRRAG